MESAQNDEKIETLKSAKDVLLSYQDSIKYTRNLKNFDLAWVLDSIKTGLWEGKVKALRKLEGKDEKNKYKNDHFGYFNIGTFRDRYRSNENLLSTEFMIFDFDHIKTQALKQEVIANPQVYAAFISPSGNGLKVIYRLDKAVTDYRLFSKLYKYYADQFRVTLGENPDKTSDASRACFISWDPDLYLKESATPLLTGINLTQKHTTYNDDPKSLEQYYTIATEGARHNHIISMLGRLINKKIQLNEANLILAMFNDKYCSPPLSQEELGDTVKDCYQRYFRKEGEFWTVKDDYAYIDEYKLFKFLEENGFGKVYNQNDYSFVYMKDNILDFSATVKMKDYLREYISLIEDLAVPVKEKVEGQLIKGHLIHDKFLEYLKTYNNDLKRDTKYTSYLYFENCFIEIRADEIKVMQYAELDKIIWKSQIVRRDFGPVGGGLEDKKSDFEIFLRNTQRNDEERFRSLQTVIGYLLHDYKSASESKAIILNDEVISDNPNGRTGKSILGKAIQKLRKLSRIDGKNFKFDRFAFQQIDVDTKIIDFNDVTKYFDFEKLFSIVTDAITVEKKNQASFNLEYSDAPKILISTNYTIKGEGASYSARMHEIEFSDHYNELNTPIKEFGRMLFEEWDSQEWQLFDNFMVSCIQIYLNYGLIEVKKVNLEKRKLINNTSSQFVDFMEMEGIKLNVSYFKDTFFSSFIRKNSDFTELKKNTFTKWLRSYAGFMGYQLIAQRSNGKDFIVFSETVQK